MKNPKSIFSKIIFDNIIQSFIITITFSQKMYILTFQLKDSFTECII